MGSLVSQASEEQLTISSDRTFAEYRFVRDGRTYTARYALSPNPPPVVLPFVFVQRPRPLPACDTLAGRGPIIDAIQLRRNGAVVSSGEQAYLSLARCPGQGLTNKAADELNGPPDGIGAALADAEYGWRWDEKATLQSGDDIIVTVLDSSDQPFEVWAGSDETQPTISVGTLSGSGSVHVP
jgi:hypothetical protein